MHAFVTTHLDYCNSLLVGLPNSQISHLHLQNTAARLISRSRKFEHITPILQSLHWLPISQRITFKILLLTFKAKHGLAPSYMTALISPKVSTCTRRLRSSSHIHLDLAPGPRTPTRYGDRAFSSIAPKLWNNIPTEIRDAPSVDSFKSRLKTYLFTS